MAGTWTLISLPFEPNASKICYHKPSSIIAQRHGKVKCKFDLVIKPFVAVCHMGVLHEKIFDYMSDPQKLSFCYSHRVRLEYEGEEDDDNSKNKKAQSNDKRNQLTNGPRWEKKKWNLSECIFVAITISSIAWHKRRAVWIKIMR